MFENICMIRAGRGCNEHAILNAEMSGLQGGVMVMAIHEKDNLNALCSPTSALKKKMLSRLGEELSNSS
jgi:hypothetical protein